MDKVEMLKREANLALRDKNPHGAVMKYSEAIKCYKDTVDSSSVHSIPLMETSSRNSESSRKGDQYGRGKKTPGIENVDGSTEKKACCKGGNYELLAQLYGNRCQAYMQMQSYGAARDDALAAIHIKNHWAKAWYRLANAQMMLGHLEEAHKSCLMGIKKVHEEGDQLSRCVEFEDLMLKIRVQSLVQGKLVGLSGRLLIVRDAGEDAWLGLPAPEEEDPPLALPSTSTHSPTIDSVGDSSPALKVCRERLTFRSIHDAVSAAVDGDEIVLMAGIHNGLGKSIDVDKRVLIRGSGTLGCTKIDHRANSPAFRMTGNAVVAGIEIDMTGFRESILVSGDAQCQPIFLKCIVRCSGDDAVNLTGQCKPLFHACTIEGRKCGVKSFQGSKGTFSECTISDCGGPGVRAMDQSSPKLDGCIVEKNKEDGIISMDRARVDLMRTKVIDNKGSGIDISDSALVTMNHCQVQDNVGGVWLWQQARIKGKGNSLSGGSSFVLMAEESSTQSELENSRITGDIVAGEKLKELVASKNSLSAPRIRAYHPPEDPPFIFEPRPY